MKENKPAGTGGNEKMVKREEDGIYDELDDMINKEHEKGYNSHRFVDHFKLGPDLRTESAFIEVEFDGILPVNLSISRSIKSDDESTIVTIFLSEGKSIVREMKFVVPNERISLYQPINKTFELQYMGDPKTGEWILLHHDREKRGDTLMFNETKDLR